MITAYVVHELPERMRIRIPERRHDEEFFTHLAGRIKRIEGVETAQVDALTTSILILHRMDPDALRSALAADAGLEISPLPERSSTYGLAPITGAFDAVNKRLRQASDGGMDLQAVVFVIIVAMAIRQILKGQIMVPAISLLWYALELAVRSRSRE